LAPEKPSVLEDAEEVRQSEHRLKRRERAVAWASGTIFLFLILVPGRDDLFSFSGKTVSVLADAATFAVAVGVPLAVLFGGADLIAWIARIVIRVWRSLHREPSANGQYVRAEPLPLVKVRRVSESQARRPIRRIALALLFLGLLALAIFGMTSSKPQPNTAPTPTKSETKISSIKSSPPTWAANCKSDGDFFICHVKGVATSPEALGKLVCGKAGLGWPIFRAARASSKFKFDDHHIPPETTFKFKCSEMQR
jgi:hypothetical protein